MSALDLSDATGRNPSGLAKLCISSLQNTNLPSKLRNPVVNLFSGLFAPSKIPFYLLSKEWTFDLLDKVSPTVDGPLPLPLSRMKEPHQQDKFLHLSLIPL
ncbi:hypothetical protein GOBAR_AA27526 [Gossypium barbadense]|uniref:Uncharacterized protein n=1 Tax=Gossypium barbadense TaxID=3634 RepID=A0A2P5WPZ7_GOSBA|nr:hypothetical protein GOBAR_AA27526 [Gossypium barbadense]